MRSCYRKTARQWRPRKTASISYSTRSPSVTTSIRTWRLLKRDGTMVIVGAVEPLTKVSGVPFIFRRRSLAGSLIGGLPETQEMLDFCGKHNITCDIEMVAMKDVNQAYDRTVKGDVKYRFVIDMASLKS